ncbi:MAG: hypothetical protein ACREJ5_02955 [Geminicoccaceae bacterium]
MAIFRQKSALFAVPLLAALSANGALAQNSLLPFLADDLKAGERLFTRDHAPGSQGLGYDISARRIQNDGSWTSVKKGASGAKNENFLIYGKPFYAMADGEVEACWRNAPDNPVPGDHHPDKKAGLIAGGGNMLLVRESGGVITLYAHARPGSIPASLCPHDARLFSEPGKTSEMDIPVGSRPKIKAGQLLGRVGNSGRSSGPHLHVHKVKDGKAHPITFARGLATPWNAAMADINKWTRFAGRSIPKGEVLIWPPRRLSQEYARHRFNPNAYSRLFDHLVDSGFKPGWFDGYSVGSKAFYNFVWRPADRLFRAWRDLSSVTYQQRINAAIADGFEPTHVESYLVNGQVRHALIVEKGVPGSFLARHGLTSAQHQRVFDQARAQSLNPVNISVVSVNGQRRYTVLYRSNNIGSWVVKSRVPVRDYQALFNAQKASGRLPRYVGAYMHDGTAHFSVVFASSLDGAVALHGLTPSGYQAAFTEQTGAGRVTRVVSGYDGAEVNHRFVGVWK